MEYEQFIEFTHEVCDNWSRCNDVTRGEAIIELRRWGVSYRNIGKWVGCSEGLIRHLEIVGGLSEWAKERIRAGEATRPFVEGVRSPAPAGTRLRGQPQPESAMRNPRCKGGSWAAP